MRILKIKGNLITDMISTRVSNPNKTNFLKWRPVPPAISEIRKLRIMRRKLYPYL